MISENLKKLKIEIPNAPNPVGSYVAFKVIGNLLFISGQLPIDSNGKMIKGKIGKDLTLEDGQTASKLCVINILAQVKKALNGDLSKVKNCVKITGFVNSTDNFTEQPKVITSAPSSSSADSASDIARLTASEGSPRRALALSLLRLGSPS